MSNFEAIERNQLRNVEHQQSAVLDASEKFDSTEEPSMESFQEFNDALNGSSTALRVLSITSEAEGKMKKSIIDSIQ